MSCRGNVAAAIAQQWPLAIASPPGAYRFDIASILKKSSGKPFYFAKKKSRRANFLLLMDKKTPKHFETAKFWGVSIRTIERYVAAGMKPESVEWMRNYYLGKSRTPPGIRLKLDQLERASEILPDDGDADLMDILEREGIEDDPKADIESLVKYKLYYEQKLNRAIKANALDQVRFWNGEHTKIVEAIRKARLMADKLGFDLGETVSRAAVEQWLKNFVWFMLRCIDSAKADLRPRLLGKDFEEEIDAELEPVLCTKVLFLPLTMSVGNAASVDLPEWFKPGIESAISEYFERPEGLPEYIKTETQSNIQND